MKKIFISGLLLLSLIVFFNCTKKSKAKPISRSEYLENLKSQIDKWNIELEILEANAKKFKGEARVKADEQISFIRSKRDELKQYIEKIQNSADNSWEDLKKGAEEAIDKISMAFSKAQVEFK